MLITLDPENAQTYKARAVYYSPKSYKNKIVAAADKAFNEKTASYLKKAEDGISYFKSRSGDWDQRQYHAHSRDLNDTLNLINNYSSGGGGLTSANIASLATAN